MSRHQLKPDYAIAHTNLGRIYEVKERLTTYMYQLAVKTSSGDGAAAAIINLARLQILHGYSSKSVDLLLQGLKQDPSVQSERLLLEQTRYAEAKAHLQEFTWTQKWLPLTVLGHGRRGDRADALVSWQNCLRYDSENMPEVQIWQSMYAND